MIRQAIKRKRPFKEAANQPRVFVAYELNGESRMSGWSSRHRLRPRNKHLCGQTCLHKLVDEFQAKSIAVRAQPSDDEESTLATATNISLTSKAAYDELPAKKTRFDEI